MARCHGRKEVPMNDDFPSRSSCFGCAILVSMVLIGFFVVVFSRFLGYWTYIIPILMLLAVAIGLLGVLWTWKPPAAGDR
jgi:hypothetical protein